MKLRSEIILVILLLSSGSQNLSQEITALLSAAKADTGNSQAYRSPCRTCHLTEVIGYTSVSMSHAFSYPNSGNMRGDFTNKNSFYHQKSGWHYSMNQRKGDYFVTQWREDATGRHSQESGRKVDFLIGSGKRAQSYLSRGPAGTLLLMPVTWYSQEARWGMTPGYDAPQHFEMNRKADFSCLHCHNSYPSLPSSWAAEDFVSFGEGIPEGIDCERCHGPGEDHMRLAQARLPGVAKAIINPRKLPVQRQRDLCMNCHLEPYARPVAGLTTRFGKKPFSFRPGDPLSDHFVYFEYPEGQSPLKGIEIAHQAYRFLKSPCFLASQSVMTCTTCHDIHRKPQGYVSFHRDRCVRCHQVSGLSKISSHHAQSDCAACHMPKTRSSDVVHVVVTDHKVQKKVLDFNELVRPIEEDDATPKAYRGSLQLLFPYEELTQEEKAVYLGMAYLSFNHSLTRALHLLEGNARKLNPIPREVLTSMAWAQAQLQKFSDARKTINLALELDPDFPEARLYHGNLLSLEGKVEEAIVEWQRALRVRPYFSEALSNLVVAYIGLGRRREAEDMLAKLTHFDPTAARQLQERLSASRKQ